MIETKVSWILSSLHSSNFGSLKANTRQVCKYYFYMKNFGNSVADSKLGAEASHFFSY